MAALGVKPDHSCLLWLCDRRKGSSYYAVSVEVSVPNMSEGVR
jgi:hypothetical protein